MTHDENTRAVRIFIAAGRVLLSLALISLVAAWLAGFTDAAGVSQPHLYGSAIALSLLGIGALIDAHWHARNF